MEKSTQGNPAAFFETFYTAQGQKILEEEFHRKYSHLSTPHCKYDSDKKTYHLYEQYNDEGDHEINEYSYIEYVRQRMNIESKVALKNLRNRLKSCNDLQGQRYAYNMYCDDLLKCEEYIKNTNIIFQPNHLKFLDKIRNSALKLFNKITSEDPEEQLRQVSTTSLEAKNQHPRLIEEKCMVKLSMLLNFLKKHEFIESKHKTALLNYYFNDSPTPSGLIEKVKWIKDVDLLNYLLKKVFIPFSGKYDVAVKIFEVVGISEAVLIGKLRRTPYLKGKPLTKKIDNLFSEHKK